LGLNKHVFAKKKGKKKRKEKKKKKKNPKSYLSNILGGYPR
jgi:hypothetical protein